MAPSRTAGERACKCTEWRRTSATVMPARTEVPTSGRGRSPAELLDGGKDLLGEELRVGLRLVERHRAVVRDSDQMRRIPVVVDATDLGVALFGRAPHVVVEPDPAELVGQVLRPDVVLRSRLGARLVVLVALLAHEMRPA